MKERTGGDKEGKEEIRKDIEACCGFLGSQEVVLVQLPVEQFQIHPSYKKQSVRK